MSEVTIPRQRAVDCVLRASDAYKAQGDERTAAVLRGVAGAVGAIEPVVHAEWATQGIEVYCTNCMMPQDSRTNYCPHCGARMDGGDSGAAD